MRPTRPRVDRRPVEQRRRARRLGAGEIEMRRSNPRPGGGPTMPPSTTRSKLRRRSRARLPVRPRSRRRRRPGTRRRQRPRRAPRGAGRQTGSRPTPAQARRSCRHRSGPAAPARAAVASLRPVRRPEHLDARRRRNTAPIAAPISPGMKQADDVSHDRHASIRDHHRPGRRACDAPPADGPDARALLRDRRNALRHRARARSPLRGASSKWIGSRSRISTRITSAAPSRLRARPARRCIRAVSTTLSAGASGDRPTGRSGSRSGS